jgi:hypothetical protein
VFKHTGNADETAVYFNMPPNYTVDAKSAKEVKIRSIGYEKQSVTVMLCITAGYKLPPCINHKSKMISKKGIFPKDITVCAQEKWMEDS